jgi:hypothetical protein
MGGAAADRRRVAFAGVLITASATKIVRYCRWSCAVAPRIGRALAGDRHTRMVTFGLRVVPPFGHRSSRLSGRSMFLAGLTALTLTSCHSSRAASSSTGVTPASSARPTGAASPASPSTLSALPPPRLIYVYSCQDYEGLIPSDQAVLLKSILYADWFDQGSASPAPLDPSALTVTELATAARHVLQSCQRQSPTTIVRVVVADLDGPNLIAP